MVSNTVDECLQRQIAKKIFKLKIEARPVNAGHYIAFKHCISFATGQVVDADLLLCTGFDSENAVLFLCHIFTQRPMTDRNIERSYGRSFGRQQLLANSIEIFISHEKTK